MKTSKGSSSGTVPMRRLPFRVCVGSPLLFALVTSSLAHADKKQPHPPIATVRIAQGQVVNGEKKPLEGAIVYLENPNSLDIKSYLTDAGGHFHFSQLAAQTDYEVWAEQNGTQSKHKFISQFSNHTRFDFTLTLDPDKKKKRFGIL